MDRPSTDSDDPATHEHHIKLLYDYCGHNNFFLPITMKEGKGSFVWDVTGKKYLDFASSYCCVNQGHCHPKIYEKLVEQGKILTQTSFVVPNNKLGPVSKHLAEIFGYDKITFMNSGYEAVDCALTLARKWAYKVKGVEKGKAKILFPKHCYWGMMLAARSGCDDPTRKEDFEPLASDGLLFDFVDFDDVEQLEAKFKANPELAAYIFEPIQGHAGNIHPSPGYFIKVRELCTKYKVLMIADEVQAGLGRTGKMLTIDWENVKADIVCLGKSLSGGYMPVSAILGNNAVMNVWSFGDMMSTYAGNPLACEIAKAAVDVLIDENMIENAEKLGKILDEELRKLHYPFIKDVQSGKGLFGSIQVTDMLATWTIAKYMIDKGVLMKPEVDSRLKFMPPLCISETDFRYAMAVLKEALADYDKKGKLSLIV